MSEQALQVGDRVQVNCPGLAQLRDIMRRATGQEPEPNHHGVITEIWDDGSLLIEFDAGDASPWQPNEVQRLSVSDTETQQ